MCAHPRTTERSARALPLSLRHRTTRALSLFPLTLSKEQNPAAHKEIWKKIWDRELDTVYDVFLPSGPGTGGSFYHNYVVNYRAHGIGGSTCYANSQMRSVWLDEDAPNMAT